MFQAIASRLSAVRRFDKIVNTKSLEFGEMESPSGRGTELAIQSGSETMILETLGQQQLLSHWKVPNDHFTRLPRELQVAEMEHFARKSPVDVMLRTVGGGDTGQPHVIRSVPSASYDPFDTMEIMEAAESVLPTNWELARDGAGRDEAVVSLMKPVTYDVSHTKKLGDLVRVGLSIANSEVRTGAAVVLFSTQRLKCLNGMCITTPEVTVRQRHIHCNKNMFRIQIQNAISNADRMGVEIVRSLQASHAMLLPNLDPDEGKLQRNVMAVLRKHSLATKPLLEEARQILGAPGAMGEDASLFGLIQFLTDKPAKRQATEMGRLAYERAAGELLAMAVA